MISVSHSSQSRGQTEPIAALLAITTVCLAVGLYAGYVTDALPGHNEQTVEDVVLERVWSDLGSDGVYVSSGYHGLSPSIVPDGYLVVVEIRRSNHAVDDPIETFWLDEHSIWRQGPPDDDPPADAHTVSRPIPIKSESVDGAVSAGTLRVVVWS